MNKYAPRVFITPEARSQLDLYIGHCPDEISGLGAVERIGRNLLISKIYLIEQEVGPGSTDLVTEAVQQFLLEMINANRDPSRIKLWWHSHVNGPTYWSGTDDKTCDQFQNGWMLAIVGNKRGEYRCRLDIYEPFRLTIDDLPLEVRIKTTRAMQARVRAEIEEKVIKRPVIAKYGLGGMDDDCFVQSLRSTYRPPSQGALQTGPTTMTPQPGQGVVVRVVSKPSKEDDS